MKLSETAAHLRTCTHCVAIDSIALGYTIYGVANYLHHICYAFVVRTVALATSVYAKLLCSETLHEVSLA